MTATELLIPSKVEAALLAAQPLLRELSAEARSKGILWRIFNARSAVVTRRQPLGPELRFWTIESDEELEEFLFQRLLAAFPPPFSPEWSEHLPRGYEPLLAVLEFERHRQFEGWTAVSNLGAAHVRSVANSYAALGLTDEAAATNRVAARFTEIDQNGESMEEELEAVYVAEVNRTSTIEARLPLIMAYVRANPSFFGEPR